MSKSAYTDTLFASPKIIYIGFITFKFEKWSRVAADVFLYSNYLSPHKNTVVLQHKHGNASTSEVNNAETCISGIMMN